MRAHSSCTSLLTHLIPTPPQTQSNNPEWKADLKDLYITAAKEVDVGKTQAIVVFVPYKLLKAYHKIQQRLVRELEKKFRCVVRGVRAVVAWLHGVDGCMGG